MVIKRVRLMSAGRYFVSSYLDLRLSGVVVDDRTVEICPCNLTEQYVSYGGSVCAGGGGR